MKVSKLYILSESKIVNVIQSLQNVSLLCFQELAGDRALVWPWSVCGVILQALIFCWPEGAQPVQVDWLQLQFKE